MEYSELLQSSDLDAIGSRINGHNSILDQIERLTCRCANDTLSRMKALHATMTVERDCLLDRYMHVSDAA
jgi:hypothetical protein